MSGKEQFFRPGGTMDPGAPSYIEREADTQLFEALMRREYVFLLDSRQKGKSSMVARTIVRLKEHGVCAVKLDLQRVGANVTADQWYAGLLVEIGQELGLVKELFDYWEEKRALGPLARWIGALQEVVLTRQDTPLVVFVDEVDFVRALPFPTDEFFAGIRDCYNRRSEGKGFDRLTFCIVGVATPGQLIRNPEITPFNIGTRIDISDFTLDETRVYAAVLDSTERSGKQLLSRVHHWLNGHPYLTQLLCSHIASDRSVRSSHDVDVLVRRLFLSPEARQREPNFSDVERRLLEPDVPGLLPDEKRTQVLDLYGRVLRGKRVEAVEENPVVATLRLSGVGLEDRHALRLRNRLYGIVFDEKWRRNSLPDAELRRQRGAARVALVRTAAAAAVVLLGVTTLALNMYRLASEREEALSNLGSRTRELVETANERTNALAALTERNSVLDRLSGERQDALDDLLLRTRQLNSVSEGRRIALENLRDKSQALEKTSEDRRQALSDLEVRTDELKQKNYVGLMASIQLAMQNNRWTVVAQLVEEARDNPLRGWEWGYVARLGGGYLTRASLLPIRNEFELDTDGSLNLVTRDAIYKVTPSGLRLSRKFKGRMLFPGSRKGDVRAGIDPETGRSVLRDAITDEILAEPDFHLEFFDPKSRTMIVQRYNSVLEKRSFDGSVLESYGPQDRMRIVPTRLANGDSITIDRGGLLLRLDAMGRQLAEARIVIPPGANPRIEVSGDESLLIHLDGDNPRRLRIRSAKDLSVISTLEGEATTTGPVAFAPDNRTVIHGESGRIQLYDVASGKLLGSYFSHTSSLLRVAYLSDGRHFASLDRLGTLLVWSTDSSPSARTLGSLADAPRDLWLCDDPRYLLFPTAGEAFESRNLATGEVARLEKPAGWSGQAWLTVVCGKKAFTGTNSGCVNRLSLDGFTVEKSVQLFGGPITGIVKLMGGKRLLVTSDTVIGHTAAKFAIVDPESLAVLHRFSPGWAADGVNYGRNWCTASQGPLFAFCVNDLRTAKGPWMGGTGLILLISAESGKVLRRMQFEEELMDGELTPDGSKLVVSLYTGNLDASSRIEVFDTSTGKKLRTLQSPKFFPALDLKIVGDLITSLLPEDQIGFWHLSRGADFKLISPGQTITDTDVSPDQARILTCLRDGTAVLWDVKTGERMFTLRPEGSGSRLPMAVLSQDGKTILMYCADGVLRAYEASSWN